MSTTQNSLSINDLINDQTNRILVRGVGWIPVKQSKILGDWVLFIDGDYNKPIYILKSEIVGVK
jgi:hypothetical protein